MRIFGTALELSEFSTSREPEPAEGRVSVLPGDGDFEGTRVRGVLVRAAQRAQGAVDPEDEAQPTHILRMDVGLVPVDRGDVLTLERIRVGGPWQVVEDRPEYRVLKVWGLPGQPDSRVDLQRVS